MTILQHFVRTFGLAWTPSVSTLRSEEVTSLHVPPVLKNMQPSDISHSAVPWAGGARTLCTYPQN